MDQVKIDGNIVAYGCNMGVTSPTPIIIYCAKVINSMNYFQGLNQGIKNYSKK